MSILQIPLADFFAGKVFEIGVGSSFAMSPRVRVECVPQLCTADEERAITKSSVEEFILERLDVATRLLQQWGQELLQLSIAFIVLPGVNLWLR